MLSTAWLASFSFLSFSDIGFPLSRFLLCGRVGIFQIPGAPPGATFSLFVLWSNLLFILLLPPPQPIPNNSPTTWFPYRSCSRIEVLPTEAWPHTTTLQLFPMLSFQPWRMEAHWVRQDEDTGPSLNQEPKFWTKHTALRSRHCPLPLVGCTMSTILSVTCLCLLLGSELYRTFIPSTWSVSGIEQVLSQCCHEAGRVAT